jgi:hypothetical protein
MPDRERLKLLKISWLGSRVELWRRLAEEEPNRREWYLENAAFYEAKLREIQ